MLVLCRSKGYTIANFKLPMLHSAYTAIIIIVIIIIMLTEIMKFIYNSN